MTQAVIALVVGVVLTLAGAWLLGRLSSAGDDPGSEP
jgi:hypothetical protein